MRNPDDVLEILNNNSQKDGYVFEGLYRNLYNRDFYLKAYEKIYAKEGNMTPGSDGQTIDGFSLQKIEDVIRVLKDESYQPKPAKRQYIPKKNSDKKRPLGISSFYDKLIQEVVRLILEAIYEKNFSENSHGFRPKRSCHSALLQIKGAYTGTRWWVEGDIKGFFDNIKHTVLINLLRKRIKDEKFIRLIWKFLKAGYMEDFKFYPTYSGTPQGGIISPILANIYLNELDRYVEDYILGFNKGKKRKNNRTYKIIADKIFKRRRFLETLPPDKTEVAMEKIEQNLFLRKPTKEERRKIIREIKELTKELQKHRTYEQNDSEYKRMNYVRYADDFLIGIIGTKEDAIKVKEELTIFLKERLSLELSQEKTLITHNSEKVRFLGYDIFVNQGGDLLRRRKISGRKVLARTAVESIKLSLPHEILVNFMTKNGYTKANSKNWKPAHRPKFLNNDELEIIKAYNSEFRGFYQYYKFAFDVKTKLTNAHFIFKQSFCKTLAGKYRTKVSKLMSKKTEQGEQAYYRDGQWGITWTNKKGHSNFVPLLHYDEIIFCKKIFDDQPTDQSIDFMPNTNYGAEMANQKTSRR
ncbi:hypothetical protein N752_08655 [Desulforamulus aquiferis]|nr:hypothetical protein N752_08655 [Desulforamulus aquiferis]